MRRELTIRKDSLVPFVLFGKGAFAGPEGLSIEQNHTTPNHTKDFKEVEAFDKRSLSHILNVYLISGMIFPPDGKMAMLAWGIFL